MVKKVLSTGQCGFDQQSINSFFRKIAPEVLVIQTHTIAESLRTLSEGIYHLVLINRIFDQTGEEGLTLLKQLKSDVKYKEVPALLVSNLADAQNTAVTLAALPGFGKAEMGEQKTVQLLKGYLELAKT